MRRGVSAAAGLVATSRAAMIAAVVLAVLVVGWQVMRFGWRPLPGNTASGTDT